VVIVLIGWVITMHGRAHWRPVAQDAIARCGGWAQLPIGAARGGWNVINRWPLLVWALAGLVALVALLLGGFSAVLPALALSLPALVLAPLFDDKALKLLKGSNSKWLWPDR
jgi:hypothetical protein